MVWLALGLTTLPGLVLVWIATQENRSARMLGLAAVLVHTLILIGSPALEPTGILITLAGVIAVVSQATLLGVLTLWIATRRSRVSRVIGGLVLAALSLAFMYGMVFGPMWKINVLNVAAIAATWIVGRAETPRLTGE